MVAVVVLPLFAGAALAGPARAAGPADPAQGDAPIGFQLGPDALLIPHLQYRPRFLVHEGRDFRPGGQYEAFHQRARLGVEARLFSWITARVDLQDVRVWGSETSTLGDTSADGFDLHQAWVEARCRCGVWARVGRQEVAWDNQRLMGAVDWSDQGRSLDGVRLGWRGGPQVEAELLYAAVMEGDAFIGGAAAAADADIHLLGLRARFSGFETLRPSLVAIYDQQEAAGQDRLTAGLYLDGAALDGLSYSAELYYQGGEQDAADGTRTLSAFLAAARASYALPLRFTPTLVGWFEWLSGDEDAADGTVRTFDTLYATNHKFYGLMDFFLNLPVDTRGLGLWDAGGRVQISPTRRTLLLLDLHHFELAAEDPRYGTSTIGNELDLLVSYKVNRYLSLETVLGLFVPKLGGAVLRMDTATNDWGTRAEAFGYLQADLVL